MSNLPDYQEANELLLTEHPPMHAEEAHGLLCGYICGDVKHNGKDWEKALSDVIAHNDTTKQLFKTTSDQISTNNFTLKLLLPPDEQTMEIRTEALAQWCENFLAGLGIAGVKFDHEASRELKDTMEDLIAISQAELDACAEDNEEDRQELEEVIEYVRMAAMFIFTELRVEEQRRILIAKNRQLH